MTNGRSGGSSDRLCNEKRASLMTNDGLIGFYERWKKILQEMMVNLNDE